MREFMHHITNAFFQATGWNEDNSYKELNATAQELIDFPLPRGLRLTLSSLATPHFATSYQLGTVGVVDGSISYLYSSVPLAGVVARSDRIPLPALLRSYRRLHDLDLPGRPLSSSSSSTLETHNADREGAALGAGAGDDDIARGAEHTAVASGGNGAGVLDSKKEDADAVTYAKRAQSTLLYGRLYLPRSLLEGLVIKRFTRALQVQLSAVSEQSLRNGGTLLGLVQYDRAKFGVEGIASTDGGFLGLRGLYNFGGDASPSTVPPPPLSENGYAQLGERERERIYGRFSAGGELYYGTLNHSGGVSLGLRFATLPAHRGTPLTATLTVNPLMGNISASYAVVARQYCSLATRMEFNVYSYESEWAVGMELWSKRRPAGFLLGAENASGSATTPAPEEVKKKEPRRRPERSFQAKLEWRLDDPGPEIDEKQPPAVTVSADDEQKGYLGVLKARLDQNLRIGLLWEGRIESLIFSLGSGVDLHKLGEPFRSLGLEVQYSS